LVTLEKQFSATVNGSLMELNSGITIAGLLQLLEIDSTMAAVEQNREIVPRKDFADRKISAGDKIEIVHFVGGG
jgi:sulfur carrier protein